MPAMVNEAVHINHALRSI